MGVCCVDGCQSDDKEDVIYFQVPVAPALRRKWREAINPSVKLHQDSRICSRHFHSDDYEKVRGKLRLKGRVVPSVFDKKESSPPVQSAVPDTNGTDRVDDAQNGGDGGNYHNDATHVELPVPQFGLLQPEAAAADLDDSTECTIECVPEAILNEESDSSSETELHKEDIEDIIANYHIQQHSKLNNTAREQVRGKQTEDSREKDNTMKDKQGVPPDKEKEKENNKDGGDTIEIEVEAIQEKRPEFIEISVDAGRAGRAESDDCLIVLENMQVDIDPCELMLAARADSDDNSVENPISLLTSSDEDDVIIQEPHIDTVEVSSETDEDDRPLVTLVKSKVKTKPTNLTRLLWGNLTEYYCFQCNFTTLSKTESDRHKLEHSKILLVCQVCNFTCASKSQFSRHKKRHKEEKRFKCKHCDYKARHNMSLVYHMKSHENISVNGIDVDETITINDIPDKYKCSDCKFVTSSRKEIIRHAKSCDKGKVKVKVTYKCDRCSYSSKRKSDLKRHRERKHMDIDDDLEYD